MQFSGVQGNATIKIKSKIMASRTNVMQMISLDLRVLFTSSSKHMYEELSEKTPQDNISWHQEWVWALQDRFLLRVLPCKPPLYYSFVKQFEGSPHFPGIF